jgi:hypothetical protein
MLPRPAVRRVRAAVRTWAGWPWHGFRVATERGKVCLRGGLGLIAAGRDWVAAGRGPYLLRCPSVPMVLDMGEVQSSRSHVLHMASSYCWPAQDKPMVPLFLS